MFARFKSAWRWLGAYRKPWISVLMLIFVLAAFVFIGSSTFRGLFFAKPTAPAKEPAAPATTPETPPPAQEEEPAAAAPAQPATAKEEPAEKEPAAAEIDELISDLGSQWKTHVARAQDKLVEIGEPAVPKLVANLYHDDKDVRITTGWTLIRISGPAVLPLLEELTECEDEDVVRYIAGILKRIGPAIGELKELEHNGRLQDRAREILAEIRKDKLTFSDDAEARAKALAEAEAARERAEAAEAEVKALKATREKERAEFTATQNAWARAKIKGEESLSKQLADQRDESRREIARLNEAIKAAEAAPAPTAYSAPPRVSTDAYWVPRRCW